MFSSAPFVGLRATIWSSLGALLGISAIALLAEAQLAGADGGLLVGSFGAAAVLLFAAPHSPLSQPRNLLGGQVLSALVGVAVFQAVPIAWLAPGLAVALAICLMQLSSTLHPPGGATALIAVIGSDSIHDLGFVYVFTPIGVGTLILFVIALAIGQVSGRPYPAPQD